MNRPRTLGLLPGVLAIALLACPTLASSADRIAVLEFRTARKDVAADFMDELGERARQGALAATRGQPYEVMTRENMTMLVKQTGGSCTDGECEVETGRNIGASMVVSGDVRKISGSYVVGVRVHETRAGKLLGSASVEGKQDLEVLRSVATRVQGLVEESIGRPRRGPTAAGTVTEGAIEAGASTTFGGGAEAAVVAFESDPAGAVVLVDGQILCMGTPCKKRVAGGSHEAVFQKERYGAASQRFAAVKGALVKGTLVPQFGWVSVETTPPGLGVSIGGVDAGKSPVDAKEQDPGGVEVVVSDPCWQRTGERVAVQAGQRRTVKIVAKARMAGLNVEAEDEKGNAVEGMVKVDGVEAGAVGATLSVPVCSKRVEVPLGKEIFAADLKLEEGKVARLTAKPGAVASAGGMVRLRGGTYVMGETNKTVTVQPFLLDVTEVTAGAYQACVKAGKCRAVDGGKDANHPVVNVDWNEATAYCKSQGKRLPTEEEWEWAARGAEKGTTYPWGNEEPRNQLCWKGDGNDRKARGFQATCAVGSYPRGDSPQGVKDLSGNVMEWTSTSYDASSRVFRGGSWLYVNPRSVSAAYRSGGYPVDRNVSLGFRCARSP